MIKAIRAGGEGRKDEEERCGGEEEGRCEGSEEGVKEQELTRQLDNLMDAEEVSLKSLKSVHSALYK